MSATIGRRAALVTLAALALALVGAGSAQAEMRYRFWHFNACGNKCNHDKSAALVTAIRRSIEDYSPHAVSLNEICRNQYLDLKAELQRVGIWEMDGRYIFTETDTNDCADGSYGIALLTRAPIADHMWMPLPEPHGTETRKLLCARVESPHVVRFCTTHIVHDEHPESQPKQISAVAREMNSSVDAGRPTVLMGDFNVSPEHPALTELYDFNHHPPGIGRFQEVDENHDENTAPCRCGEHTWDSDVNVGPFSWTRESHKYDYAFVNGRDWSTVWGDATSSDLSDHDPLRGAADLFAPADGGDKVLGPLILDHVFRP
jgi:endonuclease/exonuclease/phosphatase family metal-dependent hydrolase